MEGIKLILTFNLGPVGRSPRVEEFSLRKNKHPISDSWLMDMLLSR